MPHIHTDADPKSIAIANGLVGLGSHGHSRQEGCPERVEETQAPPCKWPWIASAREK